MKVQPAIETTRLRVRPIEQSDVPAIQQAACAFEIADTMISLPHPYPDGEAMRYFARQDSKSNAGQAYTFTIEHKVTHDFFGLAELRKIDEEHSQAELSFWLKKAAWGQGYASEFIPAVVQFGLEDLGLNRLYAYHMLRNPATGRVLEKTGFRQEGILRQRVRKWVKFEDVALWAILRQDWLALYG